MSVRIHLNPVGGIAGDMFVAAVLDCFPEICAGVLRDCEAVLTGTGCEPMLSEGASEGFRALRFGLKGTPLPRPKEALRFDAMVSLIKAAGLSAGSEVCAVGILTVLAEAEASVHQQPLADVHFHEIADLDSLLDVVAAGSIAATLDHANWTISPLPVGGGLIETRHGRLPVPAPATTLILEGFQWHDDGVGGERVTPTGAAILRFLNVAAPVAGNQAVALKSSGIGAGTRTLPGLPNILRVLVFGETSSQSGDLITVISFDIDDMTGEEIGAAAENLRAVSGVKDVSVGDRAGKKNRPLHEFRLLCEPSAADRIAERCFLETTTLGLRIHDENRVVLPRKTVAQRKETIRPDGEETAKADHDALTGDSLHARRRLKSEIESS